MSILQKHGDYIVCPPCKKNGRDISTFNKSQEGICLCKRHKRDNIHLAKKNTGGIMSTLLKLGMCIREKLHVMRKPNFCSYK